MKKFIMFIMMSFLCVNSVFADSVTENINSSLKSSSYEPNYFSILVSLVFVIFLIYVTGILYTKLNKVGVKTVRNELKESSDIKPVVLSTTPIGHDKSLQVIEINGEKLLIGVSQNSVSLIKTLVSGKKQDVINETPVHNTNVEQPHVENKTKEEHTVNADDFGLYKKYLR